MSHPSGTSGSTRGPTSFPDVLIRILLVITGTFLLGLATCQIIGWPKTNLPYTGYTTTRIVTPLSFVIILGILTLAARRYRNMSKRQSLLLLSLLTLVAIITEYIVAHALMNTGQTWDAAVIDRIAANYAVHGSMPEDTYYYLAAFGNNTFLTMLLATSYKLIYGLFGVTSFTGCSQLINSVAIVASTLLVTVTAYRLFGPRGGVGAFALAYIMMILSPHTGTTYSDTLGACSVATLLVTATMAMSTMGRRRLAWSSLFGLCLVFGYLIKPTSAILTIALALIIVIQRSKSLLSRPMRRTTGQVVVAALLGALIAFSAYQAAWHAMPGFARYTPEELDRWQRSPAVWLGEGSLRGLEPYPTCTSGGWCDPYNSDLANMTTAAERNAYGVALWKDSLTTSFPEGYGGFLATKAQRTYSDGTFGIWCEGLLSGIAFHHTSPVDLAIRSFMGPGGAHTRWLNSVLQACWMATLFLMSAGALLAMRRQSTLSVLWRNTLCAAVLGLTAYQMLFECRARYLFLFLPVFILFAVGGALSLVETPIACRLLSWCRGLRHPTSASSAC